MKLNNLRGNICFLDQYQLMESKRGKKHMIMLYKSLIGDPTNDPKSMRIEYNIWAVHFTPHPYEVTEHGFTKGVSARIFMKHPELISYTDNSAWEKYDLIRGPGVNFAVRVEDADENTHYGPSFVICKLGTAISRSIDEDMGGSEELLFYGPDVKREHIFPVFYDEGKEKYQIILNYESEGTKVIMLKQKAAKRIQELIDLIKKAQRRLHKAQNKVPKKELDDAWRSNAIAPALRPFHDEINAMEEELEEIRHDKMWENNKQSDVGEENDIIEFSSATEAAIYAIKNLKTLRKK